MDPGRTELEQELLTQIVDEPDDPGPAQVYADWLEEAGEADAARRLRVGAEAWRDPAAAAEADQLVQRYALRTGAITLGRAITRGDHALALFSRRGLIDRALLRTDARGLGEVHGWLAEHAPALRALELEVESERTELALGDLPRLRQLRLGRRNGDIAIDATTRGQLRSLALARPPGGGLVGFDRLTRLSLPTRDSPGLGALLTLGAPPPLAALRSAVAEAELEPLTVTFPGVETLALGVVPGQRPDLAPLAALPLRALTLAASEPPPLPALPRLRRLSLRLGSGAGVTVRWTPARLRGLLDGRESLEHLELMLTEIGRSDGTLRQLLTRVPQLRSLSIQGPLRASDLADLTLLEQLSELRLTLNDDPNLDAQALAPLGRLPLRRLRLAGYPAQLDLGELAGGRQLEVIELNGYAPTDADLLRLSNLPRLRALWLRSLRSPSAEGLLHLAGAERLGWLRLDVLRQTPIGPLLTLARRLDVLELTDRSLSARLRQQPPPALVRTPGQTVTTELNEPWLGQGKPFLPR